MLTDVYISELGAELQIVYIHLLDQIEHSTNKTLIYSHVSDFSQVEFKSGDCIRLYNNVRKVSLEADAI